MNNLHGVPGSQIGFDDSDVRNDNQWQTGDNVQVIAEVLQHIPTKFAGADYEDVIGIELGNEPLGFDLVRSQGDNAVVIHDAFQDFNYWDSVLSTQVNSSYWDVVVDHHHYQIFDSDQLSAELGDKIQTSCNWGWDANDESHGVKNGEWTPALTNYAPWLNGVGKNARYDGNYGDGSCDGKQDTTTWSQDESRKQIEC